MIVFFLILIYVFSLIAALFYVSIAFSTVGIFRNSNPKPMIILCIFCPIINTVYSVVMWFGRSPYKK